MKLKKYFVIKLFSFGIGYNTVGIFFQDLISLFLWRLGIRFEVLLIVANYNFEDYSIFIFIIHMNEKKADNVKNLDNFALFLRM